MFTKIVQELHQLCGNQVQIKDNKTGNFYRYCHMLHNSITVNVGDKVTTATKLR